MPSAVSTAFPSFGDRYHVERELGRGGMATVFLCTDTKFGRKVAIKLLHPDLAAAVGAERFHREIQIATRLAHPNILPAYDSGEADGSLYYVMPFVAGESLRDRLSRERQLPVQDAVRITTEIAGALQFAHDEGIVHRDIKPENILLEADRAVLADFGVARAITGIADVEALTRTGMSLGTPAYMSPEQALGEKHIDGRSDQYSLACVLYEMLCGYPPFMATTMQALVAKHLGEQVPMITTVRPAVPDELEDIVMRALEKVPADRFGSMQELADALATSIAATGTWARRTQGRLPAMKSTSRHRAAGRVTPVWRRPAILAAAVALVLGAGVAAWALRRAAGGAGGLTLDPKHVAVMYFEDLSRDKSLASTADGFTERLIDELSQVPALTVVSRRGVAPFRNADIPRDSIARTLRTGTMIVGQLEPVKDRVMVTTRLVDGNSGVDYDRASMELHPIELLVGLDSVVKVVAARLRQRLGEEVRLRERVSGTRKVDAWMLAQRAERLRKDADSLIGTRDLAGALLALTRADSVLSASEHVDPQWVDPTLARGWVALRRAQFEKGDAAKPWLDSASRHAAQAFQRAPNDARVLELRGTVSYRRWELRVDPDAAARDSLLNSARRDLEAAVEADPTLANANITLSYLYYQVHDTPSALLAARRAYEQDAYLAEAGEILNRLFWGSLDLEQFNEARRWCTEGTRRFPRAVPFIQCRLWLMVAPAEPAEPDRAWHLVALLDSVTPKPQHDLVVLQARILTAAVLARAQRLDSARRVLNAAHDRITSDVDPHQTLLSQEAYVRTLTGEPDRAIDLLKQYVAANPTHRFAQRANTVWWWRELRASPRWREVAQPPSR